MHGFSATDSRINQISKHGAADEREDSLRSEHRSHPFRLWEGNEDRWRMGDDRGSQILRTPTSARGLKIGERQMGNWRLLTGALLSVFDAFEVFLPLRYTLLSRDEGAWNEPAGADSSSGDTTLGFAPGIIILSDDYQWAI